MFSTKGFYKSVIGAILGHHGPLVNQSVENTVVAFVKGAHERNEFFEKINSNV